MGQGWRWAIPALLAGLLLGACTPAPPPPPTLPDATPLALNVAAALVTGDWSHVSFVGGADTATKEYSIVTAGLGGLRPTTVTVACVTYRGDTATATLDQSWALGKQWQFDSTATLQYGGSNGWQLQWAPSIVQPTLDGYTRLSVTTTAATRGQILANDGSAIVWNRPVFNVGIDKTKVSGAQTDTSARALAALVGVDPNAFSKAVANGGPKQFVVAITLRAGQVPAAVSTIPGAFAQSATLPLGPTATFANGLLGTASEATADDINKSGGQIAQGDMVGHSGLQMSQNAALSGAKGFTIYIGPRASSDVMVPSSAIGPTSSAAATKQVLLQSDPTPGTDLHTTLDVGLQTKAETILATQTGVASLVVLNSTTGALLVAANSPAAGTNSYATTGQYPPGSTFKISTALALLRGGMTPSSALDCPTFVTVDGAQFSNVAGYSPAHNGNITLRQAVAWSCNTAMVNGSLTLGPSALSDAAASLGLGISHNLGFPAFLGKVPVTTNDVDKAADSFGQGTVVMSPLAMAAEAASVAAGHTVTPYLLIDPTSNQPWQPPASSPPSAAATASVSASTAGASPSASPPPRTAAALTAGEDAALRDVMAAVVTIGSGTALQGLVDGAKTGTAEFTANGVTQAHAWMIAFNQQYAICAFVDVGASGAGAAGPIIKAFLS